MPQDLLIPIAFPHRVNPDPLRAHEREQVWGRRYGVDGDGERLRRLAAVQPAKLTCYTYPDAHGRDLDLVVDMNCLFFYLDDLIDELYFDDPVRARRLIEAVVRQLEPDRRPDADTVETAAFRDMWDASVVGMTDQWRIRMADGWARYLWANLAEATERRRGAAPRDLGAYLRLRRTTIGVSPSLGMVERASRFEIPPAAFHQPDVRRLETLTCDIIALCNDIASLEKEEAAGDTFNAVIVLYRYGGLSRDEALDRVVALVEQRADEFHRVSARVPDLVTTLELTPEGATAVLRWVDGARTWVGGNLDWQREAPRYRTARPPTQPSPGALPEHRAPRSFADTLVWHTSGLADGLSAHALTPCEGSQ